MCPKMIVCTLLRNPLGLVVYVLSFSSGNLVSLIESYSFEVASVPVRGKVRILKQTVHNLVLR